MRAQIAGGIGWLMTGVDLTIVPRANHKTPTAMDFMFEKLERVGPLIAYVDQSPIGRQSFGTAQPTSPRLPS